MYLKLKTLKKEVDCFIKKSYSLAYKNFIKDSLKSLKKTKLFIEIAKENKTLIIETHSEHLIRRIQRRVAEKEISNEDIIFYYIIMTEEGSKLEKLDLSEDGYIKDIPKGFFEEDYKEVFKHLMSIAKKNEEKKN